MEIDEESLRQLMSSPHGESCGIAILEGVRAGKPLHVLRGSGQVVTAADVPDVRSLLEGLGWRTNYKSPVLQRHRNI